MSDIWERKIRTFFRRVDLDKDGTLNLAEFVAMGEGIADREKLNPEQKERVRKAFGDPTWITAFIATVQHFTMSDIWERKIRTFFRRVDLNKDGTLTRVEFVAMGEGIADKEKFNPEQKERVRKAFDDLFTRYASASSKQSDVVTEESLIEALKKQRDDPGFRKCLTDMLFSFIGPMDVNHDGYLDADEYSRPFENAGLVASDFTKAGFDAIDTDHDEKLSFEEFNKALIGYMCSDDDSSTAVFGLMF